MPEPTDAETTVHHCKPNGNASERRRRPSDVDATISDLLQEPRLNQTGQNVNGENGDNAMESDALIPGRKRKHADGPGSEKKARAISPPWKKVTAEGPTSFVVDGRRKSSRTNGLPGDLQSPSSKRKSKRASTSIDKSKGKGAGTRTSNGTHPNGHATSKKASKSGRHSLNVSFAQSVKQTSSKHSRKSLPASSKLTPSSGSRRSQRTQVKEEEDDEEVIMPPPQSPVAISRRGRPRKEVQNGDAQSVESPMKLRIKIKDPVLKREHLGHFVRGRRFESFAEFLARDNPLEEDGPSAPLADVAEKDAQMRLRILRATEPGGALSEGQCTRLAISSAREPVRRYGSWDYVAKHAANFSSLMRQEVAGHKRNALRLARSAKDAIQIEDRWAFLRKAKSVDEIYNEERGYQIKRYKQVVKDVELKWLMVLEEVKRIKIAQWEKEQERLGNKALDDMLDQSTTLLRQQFRDDSELASEDITSRAQSTALENDMDMTDSDDHTESSTDAGASPALYGTPASDFDDISDDQLTQEQLRLKYHGLAAVELSGSDRSGASEDDSNIQDSGEDEEIEEDSEGDDDHSQMNLSSLVSRVLSEDKDKQVNGFDDSEEDTPPPTPDYTLDNEQIEVEEVDDILLDDSGDESTDMSDDIGDSDDNNENGDDGDEGDDEDESEDDDDLGLAGFFFSKAEMEAAKLAAKSQALSKGAESTGGHVQEIDEEDTTPGAQNDLETPIKGVHGQSGSESGSLMDVEDKSTPAPQAPSVSTPTTSIVPATPTTFRTEVSPLLRGSLREYQHDGVDWLAKLYVGGRNGILADEMGLGKTIQTIALLAHLATHHEVWGPHLVVVPTSVMLNWEMEFKKWCPGFRILTYYGNIEERKAKRRGWTNDDMWNVCITSYQLILQDAQAFKKRSWHYLILDEAHNIKNFQTQRWQTLLTFKTEARLLLTGTPLQNNLSELWSLLYFLMPAGIDGSGFAELETFLNSMKQPAHQILEEGADKISEEAQARVHKLHEVLRPYLLRRLKSEVEKQMPGKYEHVVYCRLSKRQRQLYDEFMGRADTRRTLEGGNYMSVMNCLMSLRKVCNHPDLFETRQIVTSLAVRKSVAADYEIKDMMVRRRLLRHESLDLEFNGLLPRANERYRKREANRIAQLQATRYLENLAYRERQRLESMLATVKEGTQSALERISVEAQWNMVYELEDRARHSRKASHIDIWYGKDLIEFMTLPNRFDPPRPNRKRPNYSHGEWFLDKCTFVDEMMPKLQEVASKTQILVTKFGAVTPAVVADDVTALTLSKKGMELVQLIQEKSPVEDPYHEARIRLSIAFPDKRLLQFDCGKLQALDKLMRDLQAGGHRCLIFTQMTKVLDILEAFLNIHGHRYLRLDGATKIEQRQTLTERFNNDKRIFAFILSSRSGGLGINLTGADTVIFYDLDWNPAMDAQCQDRAHRIGQTRDVHIYRFVSEYTIEANILRKSNQKRLLDDVIIQRGEFTTDTFFNRTVSYRDALEDILQPATAGDVANNAMDRVLGGLAGLNANMLDKVEDQEDAAAAKVAQKEMVVADDMDFKEIAAAAKTLAANDPAAALNGVLEEEQNGEEEQDADAEFPHVDEYMVRTLLEEFKDQIFRPAGKGKKSKKRAGAPDWKRGK